MATIAEAAIAAGAEYDRSSTQVFINQVAKGIVIEGGQFDGEFFGVPNLTSQERRSLGPWLMLNDQGLLTFNDLNASE